MLLVLDDAGDALHALEQLGVGRLHEVGDEAGQLIEERVLDADHAGVAHGAAHDLAEHVAAAFVRRNDAVVDEKGRGAGVVGDDAKDGVGARRRAP